MIRLKMIQRTRLRQGIKLHNHYHVINDGHNCADIRYRHEPIRSKRYRKCEAASFCYLTFISHGLNHHALVAFSFLHLVSQLNIQLFTYT